MTTTRLFVISFVLTLAAATLATALTTDQIWSDVFDSANNAIRINIVAS